jgi:hypothetical protein
VIASAMSEVSPPHLPSTRTGSILALRAMPATPTPLSDRAAIVPDTWVPCQLEASGVVLPHSPALNQSPSSLGFESRPLPSRAVAASLMKSNPAITLPLRSVCGVIPVSITATVTPAPLVVSQAAGALIPPVGSNRSHCSPNLGSFGVNSGCITRSGSTLTTPGCRARSAIIRCAPARVSCCSGLMIELSVANSLTLARPGR